MRWYRNVTQKNFRKLKLGRCLSVRSIKLAQSLFPNLIRRHCEMGDEVIAVPQKKKKKGCMQPTCHINDSLGPFSATLYNQEYASINNQQLQFINSSIHIPHPESSAKNCKILTIYQLFLNSHSIYPQNKGQRRGIKGWELRVNRQNH